MPTLRPRAYADLVKLSVTSHNGETLANLFSLAHEHSKNLFTSLDRDWSLELPEEVRNREFSVILKRIGGPWADMVGEHVAAIVCMHEHDDSQLLTPDREKAFICQKRALDLYIRYIMNSSEPTGWTLPLMQTLCRELRDQAIAIDIDRVKRGEKPAKLEEACGPLMRCFTACLRDNSHSIEESRRMGVYWVANLLFKTYFRLHTPWLCKNVKRGIDTAAELPPIESYTMADQITYKYFVGVLAFRNEDWTTAEANLVYAFESAHRKAARQRELILSYLIPCRLLRGVLPAPRLLAAFKRLEVIYKPLVAAMRQGDVRAFDAALQWTERRLLERGTYLAVENAREICVRTLLKRAWTQLPADQKAKIPIAKFKRALEIGGVDARDLDEVECLLSGLIYRAHMRGYISHDRQMVVLSLKEPFPRLPRQQVV